MLDAGAYVGIATHDIPIIDAALESLKDRGMGPNVDDPDKMLDLLETGKDQAMNSKCY